MNCCVGDYITIKSYGMVYSGVVYTTAKDLGNNTYWEMIHDGKPIHYYTRFDEVSVRQGLVEVYAYDSL